MLAPVGHLATGALLLLLNSKKNEEESPMDNAVCPIGYFVVL